MKKYVKPTMTIDRFMADSAVTACTTITNYNEVTLYCLSEGTETVYNTSCDTDVTGGAGTDWTIITYNGLDYFVWTKDGGGYGSNHNVDGSYITSSSTSEDMQLLINIQGYGVQNGYLTSSGQTAYHIARMNSDIVSRLNQS